METAAVGSKSQKGSGTEKPVFVASLGFFIENTALSKDIKGNGEIFFVVFLFNLVLNFHYFKNSVF